MKKNISKLLYLYYIVIGFILIFYKDLSSLTMEVKNDLNYIKCGSAESIPRPIPQITSIGYTLVLVGTPLVLITFSIITLVKANAAGNADEIDKAKKKLYKKFLISAVIFFIFFLVQFVINKVSSNDEDKKSAVSCLKCFLYYSSSYCSDDDPNNGKNYERIKQSNKSNYINSNIKINSNKKSNAGSNITNTNSGWQKGTYGQLKYLLYVPPKVSSNKPLIVQLHGAGECGKGYEAFDIFGFKYQTDHGKEINAYVLMPIIPTYTSWITYDKDTFELIEKVVQEQGIDKNKITISGVSLGGEGVSDYLEKHPGYFANAILLARHNGVKTETFKNVHTWIIFGDKDNYASPSNNSYEQLKNAGCDVRKTVYPGVGHDPIITAKMIEEPEFDSFINQSKIQ